MMFCGREPIFAEPFHLSVSDDELSALQRRLRDARWSPDFANDDWAYGTNAAYLQELVAYWQDGFDWRVQEAAINALPQFRTMIGGVPVHFVHCRGQGTNPVPLIMNHGWPWTFWDFAKVIGPLTNPAAYGGDPADSFDVIIPSLPGFGFSSPLTVPGITATRTADLWHTLMTEVLGYDRYAVHGGDWGGFVTAQLAHKYHASVIGMHALGGAPLDCFNKPLPSADQYALDEAGWHDKTAHFFAKESGYSAIQSTKPQSLSYGLNDSPIGLAAWLIEKRRSWSDCGGDVEQRFSKDELLTSIMIYWITQTIGTSARYYYESWKAPWEPAHDMQPPVPVPVGILKLEHDVCHWPRSTMEPFFNIQRWSRSEVGGHFAPAEVPELVTDELRAFFRPLRDTAESGSVGKVNV